MPDIKLKKGSFSEVVQEFLDWNKDDNAKRTYLSLMEQGVEGPAEHLCELAFWAGVWYGKTNPDLVEVILKPREIAPRFV